MLLAGAGEQIIASTELGAADAHYSGEYDNLFGALVSMAGKARPSSQSHHGRTAPGLVVSEQTAFDSRIASDGPLAISCFVYQHFIAPSGIWRAGYAAPAASEP